MDALKMAQAIARFRLLRSLGSFVPSPRPGRYVFELDQDGRNVEPLNNGAPKTAAPLTIRQMVDGYDHELAMLCELQTKPSYIRRKHA